jgi:hypothetical protein
MGSTLKRRYVYVMLFGVPGFVISLIVSILFFGAAVGFLWIFVLGDNPWAAFMGTVLPLFFIAMFLTVWLATLVAGYVIGKRREQDTTLNRTHIAVSAGFTLLFLLLILFHQVSVGNIGPKSDEIRCSEFCSRNGYAASSVSPRGSTGRSCSCLGSSGLEVITVPLESLDAGN